MPELRKLLPLLLAALALVLAACGDDQEDQTAAQPQTGTQAAPAPAETAPEAAPSGDGQISTNLEERPAIPPPSGEPPAELKKDDVVTGKGATAREGDTVSVQYVGVSYSNGQEFDASWNRGEPFEFTLGAGDVIPGWDEGVAGMKEGGRRMLTIPPDKGYGPEGTPDGSIPPNETLVFVIDLEKVTKGTG